MEVTKERMLEAIRQLPDDATVEDAIERLIVLHKVERGLEQSKQGDGISQEEMEEQMRRICPGFGVAKRLIDVKPDFNESIDDAIV